MDNISLFFKKLPWRTHKYFLTLISMFRTNIRDYGMYIALSVIFLTFGVMTNFVFLAPINFTNLLNQTAYVSVLAVGMTLVIVTRQIDLSVGYIGAFLGAYVVVAVENQAQPVLVALLGALAITVIVGIVKGFFIAKIKVPSFVVTLAGMFIFKGFLMIRTGNRTIPTTNIFFQKVGIGYLPTIDINGNDIITLGIGVVLLLAVILSGIMGRKKNSKVGIPNEKIELFITKLVFMSAVIAYLSWTLSSHKGISFLLLITVVVVVIYHFLTTQTTLGRRIYAVGGNPDAAELSGISVEKTLIIVFISMGILALISGVMYASRLQNTSPNHGPFWELYAIAAAFIGGTSASGGVGKVVNAVIGSIVIMSLKNGMALAGIDANIEPIILGSVLLLAVVFDIYTRNVRPVDLVGIHYAKKEYKEEFKLAKIEYDKAKLELKNAKKANVDNIIEFEYKFTNTQGTFNKIKDKIRVAQEEDFIKS
jgi:putative multiple sugar transport system permease protein